MSKYILLDVSNIANIAKHAKFANDVDTKVAFALNYLFTAMLNGSRNLGGDHIVACFEGTSSPWRRSIYPKYKLNRVAKKLQRTQREIDDDQLFYETLDEFHDFLKSSTNVTVLRSENTEADDLIASWIFMHPDDEHVIVSADSDFQQLLSENVSIYKKLNEDEEIIRIDGIFTMNGKPSIDKKTKQPKPPIDPEYVLFEKCIRGDTSDNIFSAYPGVRKAGTKNKTGIIQAFEDRYIKGFDWNNFMSQEWVDEDKNVVVVKDRYMLNKSLIDLKELPVNIKEECEECISTEINRPKSINGIKFIRFCGLYDIPSISKNSSTYAEVLAKKYIPSGKE